MPKIQLNTRGDALQAIADLRDFITPAQLRLLGNLTGPREERQFFIDRLVEWAAKIKTLPLGDRAIAHLHYFSASADWWITERDLSVEQHQAFGLADLGYGGALGYISIAELINSGRVEFDFYWTPKALGEIKRAAAVEVA